MSASSQALLPGPRMPALAQSAMLFANPFGFIESCRRRYGNLFRVRLSGAGEFVCLFEPDEIRRVFEQDGISAHAGEANAVLEPVLGSDSILTIDRERHLARRRLLSPAFHGEALRAMAPAIKAIVAEEIAGWPLGQPLALRPQMQRITFRVIAKIVLGRDDPVEVARLVELFEPVIRVSPLILSPPLRVDLGPFTPWGRFRRAKRRLDEELGHLIADRRQQPEGADLLGILVHNSEEGEEHQIRDDLLAFLLAGYETTATALSWAFERLARNPAAQATARRAAQEGQSDYLDAVAQETLRVRPIVADVGRVLDGPIEVGGYQLAAGTTVRLSIALVQSDERNYERPGEFLPERFLGRRPNRQIWLPFGGGRRRCIGAGLAQLEMREVLGQVLADRSVSAPDPDPERRVVRGATYVPHRGAVVELREESV
jgi:cytochrome P450 family 135